jgi:hypothetical protein
MILVSYLQLGQQPREYPKFIFPASLDEGWVKAKASDVFIHLKIENFLDQYFRISRSVMQALSSF